MIVIIHNNKNVIQVKNNTENIENFSTYFGETLFQKAQEFPDETIVWVHEECVSLVNFNKIEKLLGNNESIIHFNPFENIYLSEDLGFVDHNSLLKMPKNVNHASWQISANVGATKASVLNKLNPEIKNKKANPNYLLHSIGFTFSLIGLFCNSQPLLVQNTISKKQNQSAFQLYRFVKQHYKFQWLFFLFFTRLIKRKSFDLFPLLSSFFFSKVKKTNSITFNVFKNNEENFNNTLTLDVIIPTIGREKYVYDVLLDLKKQSFLPKKVIIVEQNPQPNSTSGLGFIFDTEWPFEIDHTFTHQPGACNARNIALSKVTSDWVFLNDDDNSFEFDLLENVLKAIHFYNLKALITAYPQAGEKVFYDKIHQTTIYGSGNSFIKSELLTQVGFDKNYEFCYGEDFDFGMQLRNIGIDIICVPFLSILHLKAPMGGFRTKPVLPWHDEKIIPKPSPTIMLNLLKYRTNEQQYGFKVLYFVKSINWKKPFQSFKEINKHWVSSLFWANKLENM
ncbi:MAG: glycosyltransferase family A protein [Bacteroidota bacterium]